MKDYSKIDKEVDVLWQASTYPPPPWWFPEGVETPARLANLTGALLALGIAKRTSLWLYESLETCNDK